MANGCTDFIESNSNDAEILKNVEINDYETALKYNKLLNQLYERKGSILVFVKTKRNADKMVDRLCRDGHKCDTMPVSYTHLTLPTNREV